MELGINGKRALITGAHRGTGRMIATQLAAEGAQVLIQGPDADATRAACDEIPGATPIVGTLTDSDGLDAVAAACESAGGVDILVNNYGTALPGDWEHCEWDDWLEAARHNLLPSARLAQLLLPTMRARGWGRIVNLGTIGSTRPNTRMPHYYAAKGALANLTVSLAKEAGPHGITVNLVSPGLILTDEVREQYLRRGREQGWGDTWEAIEAHVARTSFANPLRRIARREEVADAVLYLVSERASFITGQNLRVDGGAVDIVS